MNWQIEKGLRCDLACYAAPNLAGKRFPVRIFPGGNRQGDVPSSGLSSVLIRAPYGTRVIFVTRPGSTWERSAWRCVRVLESNALRGAGTSLPGIRIPDLDRLDHHGAKHTDREFEVSYPMAESLVDGEGWTFGRIGEIKRSVVLIRVEKDQPPTDWGLPEADTLARHVLTSAMERSTSDFDALVRDVVAGLHKTLVDAGQSDAEQRVREFEEFVASLGGT